MTKSALLLICAIFALSLFNSWPPAQSEQAHRQWLGEKYLEAISIKEGMTRADLLRHFSPDGGLQSYLPERYVLKGSGMIKVNVKFETQGEGQTTLFPEEAREMIEQLPPERRAHIRFVPDEKLKIKSISQPYLEPFATD